MKKTLKKWQTKNDALRFGILILFGVLSSSVYLDKSVCSVFATSSHTPDVLISNELLTTGSIMPLSKTPSR